MNTSRFILVTFFTLFAFVIYNSEGHCCRKPCEPVVCNVNLTDPSAAAPALKKVFKDIINSGQFPKMSKGAKCFLKQLSEIVESTTCFKTLNTCMRFITSSWGQLNRIHKNPSACMFAQIVNSSISNAAGGKPMDLVNALNFYSAAMIPLCSQYERMAAINMDCKNIPKAIPMASGCYDDGYTSEAKKAIKLHGGYLPKDITDKAMELYDSKFKADKLIATTFAFALIPEVGKLFDEHNMSDVLKTFYIVLDDECGSRCCSVRLNQLRELSDCNGASVRTNTNKMIDNLLRRCSAESSSSEER